MITGQDGEHSTGLRQSTPGLSIFPLGLSISLCVCVYTILCLYHYITCIYTTLTTTVMPEGHLGILLGPMGLSKYH